LILRITDSQPAIRRLFQFFSTDAKRVEFRCGKPASRDFASFFRHRRRHKNLPPAIDKNAFRDPRIAQYWRWFYGALSP
jgi:hypothetical protein